MPGLEEVKVVTAEVIASYEERICAVEEIIERSLEMLDQAHHAKQMVHSQLKETLAKVESLRKKDFDGLMEPLLNHQESRENEIKERLNRFLKEQRALAGQLRRVIQTGVLEKVPELERAIQETIEETKTEILAFQDEQNQIANQMQYLFDRKETLTLKEFKQTLEELYQELRFEQKQEAKAIVL